MCFAMTIRAKSKRILNSVFTTLRQWNSVMNFKIRSTVAFSDEWRFHSASLTDPIGTNKHFSDDIWISNKDQSRHLSLSW